MKRIIISIIFGILMINSGAIAKNSKRIQALPQLVVKEWKVAIDMPCNWNRKLNSIQYFRYYGEEKTQEVLNPEKVDLFGTNLLVTVDPSIAIHERTGEVLSHVEIEFGVTNKRCDGDEFNMLSR